MNVWGYEYIRHRRKKKVVRLSDLMEKKLFNSPSLFSAFIHTQFIWLYTYPHIKTDVQREYF